ncbi:hypothetical protein DL93DRAFT_2082728 [Clavulina sp. PMI_390]|nr:hypothetical protein DL93DRAFT_2082728 [Clavulina sp. PMI_390]
MLLLASALGVLLVMAPAVSSLQLFPAAASSSTPLSDMTSSGKTIPSPETSASFPSATVTTSTPEHPSTSARSRTTSESLKATESESLTAHYSSRVESTKTLTSLTAELTTNQMMQPLTGTTDLPTTQTNLHTFTSSAISFLPLSSMNYSSTSSIASSKSSAPLNSFSSPSPTIPHSPTATVDDHNSNTLPSGSTTKPARGTVIALIIFVVLVVGLVVVWWWMKLQAKEPDRSRMSAALGPDLGAGTTRSGYNVLERESIVGLGGRVSEYLRNHHGRASTAAPFPSGRASAPEVDPFDSYMLQRTPSIIVSAPSAPKMQNTNKPVPVDDRGPTFLPYSQRRSQIGARGKNRGISMNSTKLWNTAYVDGQAGMGYGDQVEEEDWSHHSIY